MVKTRGTSGLVVIKKYANRRLYDTSTSSYVTLEHLSDLVRREIDFEVVDARTGEDLTRQVLTQIIFEKENKGEGALPLAFLRKLIGFYGGGAQSLLPAWLEMSMNSYAESQERWSKTLQGKSNPFSLFEQQARANMDMFEQTMRMFSAGSKKRPLNKPAPVRRKSATGEEAVESLRAQLDAMQDQIDALAGKR